jgi:AcrR family transcriptional regulator
LGIKERRERQRREVRGGILSAARGIAADEGWRSVTIRKIAERIEYSPPVIYEHFGSKDEILLELMRLGYAEQLEAVEAAGRSARGPEEELLGMVRAWLDFAFRSPDLYQVMYGLGGAPFSAAETRKEGEKVGDVAGNAIMEVLRKNDREINDLDGKVTMIWATMHGLVALTMVGRIPGGQLEARRLAHQAARDYLAAWQLG